MKSSTLMGLIALCFFGCKSMDVDPKQTGSQTANLIEAQRKVNALNVLETEYGDRMRIPKPLLDGQTAAGMDQLKMAIESLGYRAVWDGVSAYRLKKK